MGGEHRSQLKIEDTGVVILDLGDTGLARAHPSREVLLRDVSSPARRSRR
jgi:hypothetical protein